MNPANAFAPPPTHPAAPVRLAGCALLADRHHGLTEGIRGLLETEFDFVVMVADEASLLESAARLDPALAIVDLSLGQGSGQSGLGWLYRLRHRCPRLKVIVLSLDDEPSVVRAAMHAGADGFVLKQSLGTDLLPAIEAVLDQKR